MKLKRLPAVGNNPHPFYGFSLIKEKPKQRFRKKKIKGGSMSVNDLKELSITYEGEKYTIEFKDSPPRKTLSRNEKGEVILGIAKKILREEVKRLSIDGSKDGYLYNGAGNELITHSYFRKVYLERNK